MHMTHYFPWTLALLLMALGPISSRAQECSDIQFFVVNQAGENWPVLDVNYLISNEEGMPTADGTWEVTPNGLTADFCLSVGCYSIALSGEAVNGETIGLELFQSDFIQILELNQTEGGIWQASFCVEQPMEFNCPEAIGFSEGEGCAWAFEIGSFQEGEEVLWDFGDGTQSIWGGHFITHEFEESGTYEITAFFTSYDCPMGVNLSTVVQVDGCGETECSLEMEVSSADGMLFTFSIPEQPEGAIIEWYVDGQVVPPTSENGLTFEAGFDFNPYWSVCVEVFTDACPEGMEACYTNLESSDCPDPEMMEVEYMGGCYALFWLSDPNVWEIGWSVNGVLIEWTTGIFFDYTFPSDGVYSVTAEFYSATCQGELYEWEINIEGCGEEECPLDLVWDEIECNQFFLEAIDQPEDATLFWTLDGEPYDYGYAEMMFTFEEDGCHTFGVGYETPSCPMGAFEEVEICSDCTWTECDVTIDYEELADGIYLFSAVTSNGELFEGEVNWWTGGSNVGEGNPFAWTWDVLEPMEVGMCIGYGSWQDCPGGETCIELETPEMTCEEIQLILDGEWTAEVDWAFELGFEAVIDGFEIAGWSFDSDWSADGVISDTLILCVPPACFDVFWGWDAAAVDVESLLISVLVAGMDPIVLFDWFEPYADVDFGLLPDCFDAVSVAENPLQGARVWPNPAGESIQWTLPHSDEACELTVYTLDGRILLTDQLFGRSGRLDVSDWSNGWYVLSWETSGMAPMMQRIFVVH